MTKHIQEANKNEIELFDDDPVAIPALLRFLYNTPYDSGGDAATWQLLSNHAHVYAAAEKYGLSKLKEAVTKKMKTFLPVGRQPKQHELFATLKIIWASTPSHDTQARSILAFHCAWFFKTLRKNEEFAQIMRDTELGWDVSLALDDVNDTKNRLAIERAQRNILPALRGGRARSGRAGDGGGVRGAH